MVTSAGELTALTRTVWSKKNSQSELRAEVRVATFMLLYCFGGVSVSCLCRLLPTLPAVQRARRRVVLTAEPMLARLLVI